MSSTSNTADKYVIRFPEGMRDALKKVAAENERTMNGEIIYRLKMSLDTNGKGEAAA